MSTNKKVYFSVDDYLKVAQVSDKIYLTYNLESEKKATSTDYLNVAKVSGGELYVNKFRSRKILKLNSDGYDQMVILKK